MNENIPPPGTGSDIGTHDPQLALLFGRFKSSNLAGENVSLWVGFEIYNLIVLLVHLYVSCLCLKMWALSFLLQAPWLLFAAMFPTGDYYPSGNISPINASFYKYPWSWYFIIASEMHHAYTHIHLYKEPFSS